jgi:hydrogenase maturation protein HypF
MERRVISIHGVVQGVGFRPFVYGLAMRLRLSGFVKNVVGGVAIDVEGDAQSLEKFISRLTSDAPPLAQIDSLAWDSQPSLGYRDFQIKPSDDNGAGPILFSADVATCDDCLAELFDPADRRYRYPFLNCTNCGPRLTIVTGAPYDRSRTTMADFAMCAACRMEYEDPSNRRFHAQPTCCPACGPSLQLRDAAGTLIASTDPIAEFAEALMEGKIGALKGLGGFHLACDARSVLAVGELRRRKHRDEKPFALMVADIESAERLCQLQPSERSLLQSIRRPIVVLRRRPGAPIAEEVAPRNPFLGVMLPYTPLHHLLMCEMDGIPLVMTSGNRSDEPIAYDDSDALTRLAGIADVFLLHDRPIHVRCDDSVTRVIEGLERPIRRSRGFAPHAIEMPLECRTSVLAVGGQLKGTFALGRGRQAILSHHLGDLDHYDAYRAFVNDIALYEQLFDARPAIIAHDLHPDYASTRYAQTRASGVRLLAVQHHHAHMASCMAENGLSEPTIGVCFDGTGYGTDGAIWGGEFLVGDFRGFRRAGHFRYVGMPGGDRAIHEPWRLALAHSLDAGLSDEILRDRIAREALKTVRMMIERQLNTPRTSSAGRLFDAVASMLGVRDRVTFEGQAAIELEWLASAAAADGVYPFDLVQAGDDNPDLKRLEIDTRPIVQTVVREMSHGINAATIARRFHSTVAAIIRETCERIRAEMGVDVVVLSGGVFANAILATKSEQQLREAGFRVYQHRRVPTNDGGISLGQLAVAAAFVDS